MRARIKAFLAWVYEWVTIITASIAGGLSFIPDILNELGAVDLTPVLPADKAAQIITTVAIVKGTVAAVRAKRRAMREAREA